MLLLGDPPTENEWSRTHRGDESKGKSASGPRELAAILKTLPISRRWCVFPRNPIDDAIILVETPLEDLRRLPRHNLR